MINGVVLPNFSSVALAFGMWTRTAARRPTPARHYFLEFFGAGFDKNFVWQFRVGGGAALALANILYLQKRSRYMLSNDYTILNQPNEAVDCEPIGAVRDSFDLARNKMWCVRRQIDAHKVGITHVFISGGILTQIFNS